MSLAYQILGAPAQDNALLVRVDSGQSVERLLFDCGEGCLHALPFGEILEIDQLFFSHLHMDHVGGFDSFFRCNFSRIAKANRIWGPPQTAAIMQHRFQGYLWNLHEQLEGSWLVSEIHPQEVVTTRFELNEAFAVAHSEDRRAFDQVVFEGEGCAVEAITMDHRTPSMAYIVREHPRTNVDTARLATLGLKPGVWLKSLKDPAVKGSESIEVSGQTFTWQQLRDALLVSTPGNSIAYLTDFLLDDAAAARLVDRLRGCRTLVCEAQYRHADLELAHRHYHMTTALTAELARSAGVGELVLFHLSSRYERTVWREMLAEAQAIFPQAKFAPHWNWDGSPKAGDAPNDRQDDPAAE